MPGKKTTKRKARPVPKTTAPPARPDRQADDEFCVCCEEACACEDCAECTADVEHVVPTKARWA